MKTRFVSTSKPARGGFTLTEILIVVVIIVLLIGMALPVFRTITGSRSEEGARNQIAAVLGRARADAMGLNQPMGVAFVYNPSTQKSYMAEVSFPDCPEWTVGLTAVQGTCVKKTTGTLSYYFYWTGTAAPTLTSSPAAAQTDSGNWQWVGGPPLDIRPDTDLLPLPAGIGVQTICNSIFVNGVRTTDGYLSVGVILFDGKGRVTSLPYGIPFGATNPTTPTLVNAAGLTQAYPSHNTPNVGTYNSINTLIQFGVMSQYGLVVFQNDPFVGQNFPTNDPLYNYSTLEQRAGAGYPNQQTEEQWLDANATPVLIDRYTGTVIKGE